MDFAGTPSFVGALLHVSRWLTGEAGKPSLRRSVIYMQIIDLSIR